MRDIAGTIVAYTFFIFFYSVLPALIVWGWIRWARRQKSRDFASITSFVAFALATASALLAVASIVYAHMTGGFPFYDPRLLRIYRWGFLLSSGAFLFSLGGVWRSNPLRWHALVCALGNALFWVVAAEGE